VFLAREKVRRTRNFGHAIKRNDNIVDSDSNSNHPSRFSQSRPLAPSMTICLTISFTNNCNNNNNNNKIIKQTKMSSRSLVLSLFLLVFISMLNPSESLISTAPNALRNTGAKLSGLGNAFHRPEMLEAVEHIISPPQPSQASFDTDAYRQQMIDLVYKRSMERFS
jgi:hypothetical protein